ncbi:unnamed protein product, partial [Symbiodinium pilosum]
FRHPDGREIDEKRGNRAGKGSGKTAPCAFRRRRSRSAGRSKPREQRVSCSQTPPPRQRFVSQTPSRKPPAERRLAPPAAASPKPVKDLTPSQLCFRDFVLEHVCDEDSPERALELFARYLRQWTREELEAIQTTGLFFDLYHPLSQIRKFNLRLGQTQLDARVFVQDLQEGRYQGLSLLASQPRSGATCPVAGDLQAPEFALDPDADSLMISGLTPAVSVWDVLDVIQDCSGFCKAAWTHFDKNLAREFYARFASKGDATAAAVVLMRSSDTLPGAAGTLGRVSVLSSKPELSAHVLPQEMSQPEQILKDLALSEDVIRRLDGLLGVSEDVTKLLLNVEGSTEFKLDLRVLYLRRVHHFCFYAARWCDDEWSLRNACGVATVRERPSAPCKSGTWSAAHEERLRSFLGNVHLSSTI